MDCSLPGSSVHAILHTRILEWVAFPLSRGSSQPRDQTQVSFIAGGFFTSWAVKGSLRIPEWVAYPFSSRSSPSRNQKGASCCRWILYQLSYQGSPLLPVEEMWETWVDPWVRKISWRKAWQPTPVFWPGEFHGLYSPWGRKESDMTESHH